MLFLLLFGIINFFLTFESNKPAHYIPDYGDFEQLISKPRTRTSISEKGINKHANTNNNVYTIHTHYGVQQGANNTQTKTKSH